MVKNSLLLALLASLSLAACGGDDGGEGTVDPGPDAGDTSGGGDTVTPDGGMPDTMVPDAEEDVPPQPVDEICGNFEDDDLDGAIDCDDTDCAEFAGCALTCTDDPSLCGEGEVCEDGSCVAGPVDIDDYEPAGTWAYVNRLQLGATVPANTTEEQVAAGEAGPACCFDIDGDGFVDNGLGQVAQLAGSFLGDGADLDSTLAGVVEDGTIVLLAEYRAGFFGEPTNPAKLHFFIGTTDNDNDGEPNDDYSVWGAGEGTFLIEPLSFGENGSLIQFNNGDYDAATGSFQHPAARFNLSLPLDGLLPGIGTIDLTIQNARLEATLGTTAETVTDTTNLDIDGVEYGGARLGGYINLDDLFSAVARILDNCDCAVNAETGESPSLCYGDSSEDPNGCEDPASGPRTRYFVACGARSYDISACDADSICQQVPLICGTVAPALGTLPLADFDTNAPGEPGFGVDDAITVGIWLSMVGANIGESFYAQETEGSAAP